MKYPECCKNVIDVTKAPYFADNSGNSDCTEALCRAIDDCLRGYLDGIKEMREKLLELWDRQGRKGNVYIDAEAGKIIDGQIFITFPEKYPNAKILYFPKGTYLVSDTVTYIEDKLFTAQAPGYNCQLCRNIHILGENREDTVIKLSDNSRGFERGSEKPVLSFNKASTDGKETTNCAQMNTLEGITIDCGAGNDGAVGVLYAASNCGRIENVNITGKNGYAGIKFDYGSEAVVTDVNVEGFDYGMKTEYTSPLVLENIDFSENRVSGILTKDGNINCRRINWGKNTAFEFMPGCSGRYFSDDENINNIDACGNYIFFEEKDAVKPVPAPKKNESFADVAFVDDFGAIGDGVTDSTYAIQQAMDSGKTAVVFGEGRYVINKTIKVPESVNVIDFMYCELTAGYSLIIGEMDAAFDICTDGDALFAEHLVCNESFSGFFRAFKHSGKRDVVLRDIAIPAPLYVNTLPGVRVWFDNCFTLTNHYAQDAILHRDGYIPVFCRMIPVELHNMQAFGKNLNIERGELELLNDASVLVADGYKTEGPGMLAKTINGGKTVLNLFNAGLWCNRLEENSMLLVNDAEIDVTGGLVFYYVPEERYCTVISKNGEKINMKDCTEHLEGNDALGRDFGNLIRNIKVKNDEMVLNG